MPERETTNSENPVKVNTFSRETLTKLGLTVSSEWSGVFFRTVAAAITGRANVLREQSSASENKRKAKDEIFLILQAAAGKAMSNVEIEQELSALKQHTITVEQSPVYVLHYFRSLNRT